MPLRSLHPEYDIPKEILKPASMITPKGKFYVLQIGEVPVLKAEHWRMGITGLVEKPIMLNYENITGMESVTTMGTLKCIGDPIGEEQMSNAMWTGVPLRNILDKVLVLCQINHDKALTALGYGCPSRCAGGVSKGGFCTTIC